MAAAAPGIERDGSPGVAGALVALGAFVGIFATTPGQTVGVSSFVDPIALDLGLTREAVLALYSVGTFLGILTAPTVGRLVDRFGPRRLALPIVLALGGACLAVSLAWDAWSLALGFVLLRATAIAGLSLVTNQMINLWFDRFRGRVTALSLMGMAVGGLLVPPVAEMVTRAEGWRAAYLALSVGVVVIMVPTALGLYRDRPRLPVMRDFGRPGRSVSAQVGEGLTLGEAARTVTFWYLLALTLLVNAVNTALLLDHVRALSSAGVGRTQAIALLGAVTTTQAVFTLATGVLVDRYGARPIGLLGLALLAASVLLIMVAPGLAGGLAYAVTLGAMIGMLQVAHSSGLGEAFGTAHLGSIKGMTFLVGVSGAALGPLPLLLSPSTAYVSFLVLTACGAMLGISSLRGRKVESYGNP